MNDFTELLKEAFVGEEPYDPHPARADVQAALHRFESRDRTLRYMMWFAVAFMTAVAAWSAWRFFASGDEATTRELILYAALFLWANVGVGWAKMFLFTTQKHLSILKELKRVQLLILDAQEAERP